MCSATRSLPRVQTVRNPADEISTELSSWTANLSSPITVYCTMASKPGMGSGSRQGLHELQVICGTTAHQHDALNCSSVRLFLLLPHHITYGTRIDCQGIGTNGACRATAGKNAKGEERQVLLTQVSNDARKGGTCASVRFIRLACLAWPGPRGPDTIYYLAH